MTAWWPPAVLEHQPFCDSPEHTDGHSATTLEFNSGSAETGPVH